MSRWLRPAAVSKTLLVILVLVAVGAALFWGLRWRSSASAPVDAQFNKLEYILWCPNCKEQFKIPTAEAKNDKNFPRDEKNKVRCPKCKKFTASWGPPRGGGGVVQP